MKADHPNQFTIKRKKLCGYVLPEEEGYSCPFEPTTYPDYPRYCIYHLPKKTASEIENLFSEDYDYASEINRKFRAGIGQIIEDGNASDVDFLDFRGFQFPSFVFPVATLPKAADFSYSKFIDVIDFAGYVASADIREEATSTTSLLKHGANFTGAVFKQNASFTDCEVSECIDFSVAKFHGDADFRSVNFANCNFSWTDFDYDCSLSSASLTESTFQGCTFGSRFYGAHLKLIDRADFSRATFRESAHFYMVRFGVPDSERGKNGIAQKTSAACFKNSEATKDFSFANATFEKKAEFKESVCYDDIEFDGATFHRATVFDGSKSEGMFKEQLLFRNVNLPKDDKDENLIFENVNLTKASFHDTDLVKVVFRDVTWREPDGWKQRLFRGDSYILWDEVKPPTEEDDEHRDKAKTAENYRQLVLNYEAKRDYYSAEGFHVGEMEMRRKTVGGSSSTDDETKGLRKLYGRLRRGLNGYGVYWLTSRYGTSYVQAAVVLILILLGFSLMFLFAGLKASETNKQNPNEVIEYNLVSDAEHSVTSLTNFSSDLSQSLLYTVEVATLQKERLYEPTGWQGRFLVSTAFLILAGQAALVLLAVRRRFRRE